MQEIELGGEKSFVGAWLIPDASICDDLITYFQQRDDKTEGVIGNSHLVDKAFKDSLDVAIKRDQTGHPAVARYLDNLRQISRKYAEKYTAAALVDKWGITEAINIQYYRPMGGYVRWHTERTGKALPFSHRHLVFMTYLNDVSDQGGTEFYHQKLCVSPRKGLTLIWPADWTHLHRGVTSPSQEKYIITGWFDFV